MSKKIKHKHVQMNLFGLSTEHKKPRNVLTEKERLFRKEKSEAHIAWKFLKSRKFKDFSDRQKFLLKKYYKINLT